jgi:hypothetical protein
LNLATFEQDQKLGKLLEKSEGFYEKLEETKNQPLLRKAQIAVLQREIVVLQREREIVGHQNDVVHDEEIESLCTKHKLSKIASYDKSLSNCKVRRYRTSSFSRFRRQCDT